MGFKMPHALTIVAIACAGLGLVLQVVGVATTGWLEGRMYYGGSFNMGLFKMCGERGCTKIGSVGYLDACRAFGILGVLAFAGCAALGVLSSLIENKKVPVLLAVLLGFGAGLCCLIEIGVFAGNTNPGGNSNYSYSFALTIVAGVLGLAAGVCYFLSRNKNSA